MKYCTNCGSPVAEGAKFCENCGARLAAQAGPAAQTAPTAQAAQAEERVFEPPYYDRAPRQDDAMATVVKVFLILGCITFGWAVIPLAWCIPITVSIFRKLNNGEPIGVGLKVCAMLFVNLIAGILLLCMPE